MNIYTIQFHANCPTNGVRIAYSLRIESQVLIPVEQIVAAVEAIESGDRVFHEEIADRLAAQFPGEHRLSAHHHGVGIETVRIGAADA